MNANKKTLDLRLSAFIRGVLKTFTHYLHYVFGYDSQVVGDYPEPEGAGVIAIGRDRAYCDSALTGYADVRRRRLIVHTDIDVVGC